MEKKGKGFSEKNAAVGGNSGRVGNVRYYTRGDRTYTRTASCGAKNPRSEKQQRTRAKLGNVMCQWGYLKDYVREYFEYANKSVTAYNIFTKRAMQSVPIYLAKKEYYSKLIAAPYCVSEGSLPMVRYDWKDGRIVSNISLGEGFVVDENTTVVDFVNAVKRENEGFQENDELVFIGVLQLLDENSTFIKVECAKIGLDGTVEGHNVSMTTKLHDVVDNMGFESADGMLSTVENPFAGCYAWIHVRRDRLTGEVVSSSTQELFNANEDVVAEYSSEEAFNRVYDSYGKK